VWVIIASWNASSVLFLEVLIPHVDHRSLAPSEVSVLCVECVEYTRTRARAGSGSRRVPSTRSSSFHAIGSETGGELGVALGVGRVLQGLATACGAVAMAVRCR